MEDIIEILKDNVQGVDFANEKHLITDGLITSFDLIMIIGALNQKFNVNITANELVPENFESVEAIESLIDSLK